RLKPGQQGEILHAEMTRRPGTAVSITDRSLLCVGYELGHRIDRNGGMHDQQVGAARPERQKSEVRVRVEWELVVEARIYGECRAERYEDGVPIGSGPRNGF